MDHFGYPTFSGYLVGRLTEKWHIYSYFCRVIIISKSNGPIYLHADQSDKDFDNALPCGLLVPLTLPPSHPRSGRFKKFQIHRPDVPKTPTAIPHLPHFPKSIPTSPRGPRRHCFISPSSLDRSNHARVQGPWIPSPSSQVSCSRSLSGVSPYLCSIRGE